jgi:hypothetical protein
MTFTTRPCVFAVLAITGFIAWQWNAAIDSARDLTPLAIQQFKDARAAAELREAAWAQNRWPFIWPGLLALVGAVMFWDDVKRWWKKDDA